MPILSKPYSQIFDQGMKLRLGKTTRNIMHHLIRIVLSLDLIDKLLLENVISYTQLMTNLTKTNLCQIKHCNKKLFIPFCFINCEFDQNSIFTYIRLKTNVEFQIKYGLYVNVSNRLISSPQNKKKIPTHVIYFMTFISNCIIWHFE